MKRSDIARTIQVQFKNMRETDALAIVGALNEEIISAIARGDRIEIRGFGTFCKHHHAPRIGYNPVSGDRINIEARNTIWYKPSRELIKKMNG